MTAPDPSPVPAAVEQEREFLEASVAVWRHLDKHGRCPAPEEFEEGKRLREREKAAWEAYKLSLAPVHPQGAAVSAWGHRPVTVSEARSPDVDAAVAVLQVALDRWGIKASAVEITKDMFRAALASFEKKEHDGR